jgi:NAD(P)-dependent dehydrogenase (short-subunit alcohol dehydrogenase family)
MRALITGASHGGIGGAIALELARQAKAAGSVAKIAISATGARPSLALLEREIRDSGAELTTILGDLSDPAFPVRLVDEAASFCGGLDALVSNAGLHRPNQLVDATVEDWDLLFAVHARAAWLLAKSAYPHLKASKGAMVATGSITGTAPHYGQSVYPAAKAALIVLCQQLALEWGKDGIRVNVVSPGPVRTEINAHIYADPERVRVRNETIPIGRLGEPNDVAKMTAFLLGPDAGFVTGQNIVVDGGLLISSLNRIGPLKPK